MYKSNVSVQKGTYKAKIYLASLSSVGDSKEIELINALGKYCSVTKKRSLSYILLYNINRPFCNLKSTHLIDFGVNTQHT